MDDQRKNPFDITNFKGKFGSLVLSLFRSFLVGLPENRKTENYRKTAPLQAFHIDVHQKGQK